MHRGMLNLGILAHVDAGKTTLTERVLYCAGVIDQPGSVDEGTTQTDSLALERQRGITIKSAVASFAVGGIIVNLIDTPGHPDFIAEVERALSVLDGVVLVVSAVEGVQPQTRVLWRALQRLRVPALVFVNKIDRRGAGYERLLDDIAGRLTSRIIPMGEVRGPGTPAAAFRRTAAPIQCTAHGSPRPSPITTTRSWPPTSTARTALTALTARAPGAACRTAGCAGGWPGRSRTPGCTRCTSGRPRPARASRR